MSQNSAANENNKKKPGFLSNLLLNVVIPSLILSRLSGEDALGPLWSIVVALAFPLAFGAYEIKQSGKVNFLSVLGVVSVLLTGGISLLQLDPSYIAIKEALIPGLIGVIILISQFTPYPFVKKFLINPDLLNTEKLYSKLEQNNMVALFEKRIANAGNVVALAFFVSSALNYILAKMIVVSPAGTTAYAEELGKMTWLSYPVIVLPVTVLLMGAMVYIFKQIGKLTGLPMEEFINQ